MTVFKDSKDDVLSNDYDRMELVQIDGQLFPPQYTTAERDALSATAGLLVYNSTTNKLNFYNGSAWEAVTSS